MQLKNLPIAFLICLISSCSHGPKVNVCLSSTAELDCSDWKGRANTVSYADSANYRAYSAKSYQNVLDYCAKRTQTGTAAPQFDSCVSIPASGGFACVVQECTLNDQLNGIQCESSKSYFVTYAESQDYIALSESDDTTVMAYCNINIKDTL